MQISYPNSNRLGKFQIRHEVLCNDAERPWLRALFGLCKVLPEYTEPHESGRGIVFYAASELFEPLVDGSEIPEYRLVCELVEPFTEEENRKALALGGFKFYAVRNNIVRVPAAQLAARVRAPGQFH